MTKNKEYEIFETLTKRLLGVPHSEIKAKLDEEKKAKEAKKKAKTQK